MELLLADQLGFPRGFDGYEWASPQIRCPRKRQMPSYLVESLPNSDGLSVRQKYKEVSFAEAPKFSYFHPIIASNFEVFRKKQDQKKRSRERRKLQKEISDEQNTKEDKKQHEKLISDLHYLKIFGDKQSPLTVDCITKLSQIFKVPVPTKRQGQTNSGRYSRSESNSQNEDVLSSQSSLNISQKDEYNSCSTPVQKSSTQKESQPYFYYSKSRKVETNLSQKSSDENDILTLKNIINTRYNNMSETESNPERDLQILSLPQRNTRSQFSEYLKGDETLSKTFYSHNRSLHQYNRDNSSSIKASTRAFTATPQSRCLGFSQKGLQSQTTRQRYPQEKAERVKTAAAVIHRTTTPSNNSLAKNSRIGCFSISTNDISLLKTSPSGLRGRIITETQHTEEDKIREKQPEISEKPSSQEDQIIEQKQLDAEFIKNIAVQQRSLAYANRILSKKYGLVSREKSLPKQLFL